MHSALQYRFKRTKRCINAIEVVYDGMQYKRLFISNGILTDSANISLKHNTDGVYVFNSSNKDVWPVYFEINELPPNIR